MSESKYLCKEKKTLISMQRWRTHHFTAVLMTAVIFRMFCLFFVCLFHFLSSTIQQTYFSFCSSFYKTGDYCQASISHQFLNIQVKPPCSSPFLGVRYPLQPASCLPSHLQAMDGLAGLQLNCPTDATQNTAGAWAKLHPEGVTEPSQELPLVASIRG